MYILVTGACSGFAPHEKERAARRQHTKNKFPAEDKRNPHKHSTHAHTDDAFDKSAIQ